MAHISLGVVNNSYGSTNHTYPNTSTSSTTRLNHPSSTSPQAHASKQNESSKPRHSSSKSRSNSGKSSRNNRMYKDTAITTTSKENHGTTTTTSSILIVAHKGSLLRRTTAETTTSSSTNPPRYISNPIHSISIPSTNMELHFDRLQYERITNLFSIIDTESKGVVSKKQVCAFVALRCPVFRRRDELLFGSQHDTTPKPIENSGSRGKKAIHTSSSTFDEVWNAVICSDENSSTNTHHHRHTQSKEVVVLGIEGFAIFCRFIALAQYLEARQRFSQRHLQQTQNVSGGDLSNSSSHNDGELVVMVEVPPPSPPGPLHMHALKQYEEKRRIMSDYKNTPFPELDLNHCLVASHDDYYYNASHPTRAASPNKDVLNSGGKVMVAPFGQNAENRTSSSSSSSAESIACEEEFVLTFCSDGDASAPTSIVRRTLSDMEWLYNTFSSHKELGGTLCGRILPPFPKKCSSDYRVYGVVVNTLVKSLLWGLTPSNSKKGDAGRMGHGKDAPLIGLYARQLERCLNYLLEHPALFSSFPLNAILKASQIGLQAAKGILEEETTPSSHPSHTIDTCPTADGSSSEASPSRPPTTTASSSEHATFISSSPASSFLSNLSWVRTAAQAAMALKLHGILDATGYASASARLQHASLPNLDTSRSLWRGDNQCSTPPPSLESSSGKDDEEEDVSCFENGVVKIQSELENADDDYDLLPSPCTTSNLLSAIANSAIPRNAPLLIADTATITQDCNDSSFKRYSYGPLNDSTSTSYTPSVDADIDKLSEIITSVHSTLSRCSVVSQTISDHKRERETFHSNVVRGLDSWISLRGYELMSERALLNAVSSLDSCTDIRVNSDASLNDNLAWQASLASCAVSATEDVRSAIQASNTALSAKAAAESAALSAQKSYESMISSSTSNTRPEDLRILRTRASISHSHAIYAAVIQHESFSAKRKAALALAHDVHFWNLYRRREILSTCLEAAKSQRNSASKAVNAWELLRMGLFGQSDSSDCSTTTSLPHVSTASISRCNTNKNSFPSDDLVAVSAPSTTFISCPKIIPVDHVALALKRHPIPSAPPATYESIDCDFVDPKLSSSSHQLHESAPAFIHDAVINRECIDKTITKENILCEGVSAPRRESQQVKHNNNNNNLSQQQQTPEGDLMSTSMQSLVDGLMTWGFAQGQYDPQDDMSLPTGMAVSIALEETAAATTTCAVPITK